MSDEIKSKELSEEEADKAFSDDEEEANEALAGALEKLGEDDQPQAESQDEKIPPWVIMPGDLKLPPPGTQISYVRIPARWTKNPAKGDQWCACWPISDLEENSAWQRARGEQFRLTSEMAKQMIRVINGQKVDWTGKKLEATAAHFWSAIGPKGRTIVRNIYLMTHQTTAEDMRDFFSNHFGTATVGGG